jgi:HPt (histidine-containing phosphotransfer) domain-containing protein
MNALNSVQETSQSGFAATHGVLKNGTTSDDPKIFCEYLDRAALDDLRAVDTDGGTDLVVSLIELFLQDAEEFVVNVRYMASQRDFETLQRTAHSFKTNSATLGATRLSLLCKELEVMARKKAVTSLEEHIDNIEVECSRAQDALRHELERLRS